MKKGEEHEEAVWLKTPACDAENQGREGLSTKERRKRELSLSSGLGKGEKQGSNTPTMSFTSQKKKKKKKNKGKKRAKVEQGSRDKSDALGGRRKKTRRRAD